MIPLKRTWLKRKPRKPQAGDDPKYRAWIRTLPCIVCFPEFYRQWQLGELDDVERELERLHNLRIQKSRTEVAHVGERGFGRLCPDKQTLPLCGKLHHREGPESHHASGKMFWVRHGIDRTKVILFLNQEFEKIDDRQG